jgi:hypothetical protein
MDVVYTYVNHRDPNWSEQYRNYASNDLVSREAALRFLDSGELRYSLRSVEENFDSNGKIIIFTNSQLPQWLDRNHPRLRVVEHSAVINETYRPLFHSHAIESFLHLIPDVSDNFLYLNDDFLMMKAMSPRSFICENKLIFRCNQYGFRSSRQVRASLEKCLGGHASASALSARLPAVGFALTHAGFPVNVDLMGTMMSRYPREIEALRNQRFRSEGSLELVNFLYPYFCVDQGRAILKLTRENFVRSRAESLLQNSAPRFGGNILRISRELISRLMIDCPIQNDAEKIPEFACVNEGIDAEVSDILESWFPHPSSFELPALS